MRVTVNLILVISNSFSNLYRHGPPVNSKRNDRADVHYFHHCPEILLRPLRDIYETFARPCRDLNETFARPCRDLMPYLPSL
jgi:hypothetical protein